MSNPELKVSQTAIPGLLEIDLVVHGDDRGWFKENWRKDKLTALGLPADFQPVQHSLSYNKEAGVTRGIHAEPWDKYISVAFGKVFAAFVELRNVPEFGTVFTCEITPDKAIYLPRGCGNSFQTLEPDTVYTYLVNDYWSPEAQYTMVNLADETLSVNWPVSLDQAIISDKDRQHPRLADVKPFEV